MIPGLVTLAQVKTHLHIINSDSDDDIALKILMASELVMNHYKHFTIPDEWIIDTTASPLVYDVPMWAQVTTILGTAELFYQREASAVNVLSDAVKGMIPRDPTIA